MATKPNVSSSAVMERTERGPQLVPTPPAPAPQRPGIGVPAVLVAIAMAIALVVALVSYIPRLRNRPPVPSAAEVPAQPNGSELQFSSVHLTLSPTGGALAVDGQVTNAGDNPITGVMARLTFRNARGTVVGTSTSPLQGVTSTEETLVRDDFSSDPLEPRASRPFRIRASRIPTGWNHAMPEIKLMTVSEEGSR